MATSIEIYGYHGTTTESAKRIIKQGFAQSRQGYDWLGDGIYFWQDAPERAWEWAKNLSKRRGEKPAVVGVKIRFNIGQQEGNTQYVDLLDIPWEKRIGSTFRRLKRDFELQGLALPKQTTGAHRLDYQVVNSLVEDLDREGIKVLAMRAAFQEGIPIFEESALHNRSHVQIAVRDEGIIIEKWIERRRRRR